MQTNRLFFWGILCLALALGLQHGITAFLALIGVGFLLATLWRVLNHERN